MEAIYQIGEVAATAIEIAILLDFIGKILDCKYEGVKKNVQFICAFVVLNTYMNASVFISEKYSAFVNLFCTAMYVIYAVIFTKSNILYKIVVPIVALMTILFINLSISLMISKAFNYTPSSILEQRNSLRLVLLFATKFTFFIITRIVLKIVKPKNVVMSKQELISISIIFILSVTIVGYSSEFYYNYDHRSIIGKYLIILLVGHLIINVLVFAILTMLAKKNQEKMELSIMKAQFEEQKKSYDSVQTVYHNLQILQHDLKNEFLCLYNLIDNNQNEKAKEYITKFSETNLNRFHEYIKTGNEIIDAIINVKLNYAREKGINVICNINTDFCGFETDDIVRLFSNTIDNAIEVCLKQENSRINVSMENKRNYLSITISNTIISSVLENNSEMKTTKKDPLHHGFGTQSMKSITEKYDGMLEFYEKEGMFITDIMIKKSKEIPNTK